ncbi:adenylate/guanylate cyclase domain-containing protein [Acuticoccus kandeliae]|uniref:adenylate/guanylate cyclase domain-containing protein n=1 Tax=Acuticoccus kandeliae TaxID=2073160 RepID=UPI000D3E4BE7|nr:adenylate/guanylate cyclase domain-containing protein [Acuticoccus kandeliae]
MERRLAAILAADVAGYSRLVRHDEDATLAALANLLTAFINPLVAAHRGRIVKVMGDGLLIEFRSTVDAVNCAIAWQTTIADEAQAVPLAFRIGINLGDIVVAGKDILGDGVNVASRLEGLSETGGLCISDAVHEQIRDRMGAHFEDGGERHLKNIERPVRVWMWRPEASAAVADAGERPADVETLTIAVSPFRTLSTDPDEAYFAEGIGEDLIVGLSRNPALRVVSRAALPGASPHGGDELVLEGSVRRAGGHTRVAARLTEAKSGRQVWAGRFDSEVRDLFALQDDMVASIVHALGAADGVIERSARLTRERTAAGGSAYDWYLKGRHLFYKHGDAGIDEAEACYLKALELDEDLAPASSALAWLHFVRFKVFGTKSFAEIRAPAVQLSLRALALDPEDFRAHWVLGAVHLHEGEHALCAAEFDKALQINPNDANLLAWTAEALVYAGHLDEAVERCDRAMRINPNGPDWYHWVKAFARFHQGRYALALAELSRMSTPDYAGKLKSAVHALLGEADKAAEERDAYLALVPGFRIGAWARTECYADLAELDRYVDGLRKAGFPE